MARILGIDYGKKRTGIAATDPLQLIVSPIGTHDTKALIDFLKEYIGKEEVEKIVIGMPVHADGNYTYLKKDIDIFAAKIRSLFPDIRIDYVDESHTSIQAKEIILQAGVKKKKRRDKHLVDKISAVLILQRYLNHI